MAMLPDKFSEVLTLEKLLWPILTRENILLISNFAEQVIRTAVIWRKIRFRKDSELGSLNNQKMTDGRCDIALAVQKFFGVPDSRLPKIFN